MDEMLYNILCRYFSILGNTGYVSYDQVAKLLVLNFYRDLLLEDYHGLLTNEDILMIEKAFDCLYGSTCLIPYYDYLKMGKLNIGSMNELACRVKALEEAKALKAIHDITPYEEGADDDIIVTMEEGDN